MNLQQDINRKEKEIKIFPRNYVNRKITNQEAILRVIAQSSNAHVPVHFIGLWGAMNKKKMDNYDREALERLFNYSRYLNQNLSASCLWTCILCDSHGITNGYDKEQIRSYLWNIEQEFKPMEGFFTSYMSEYWTEYHLEEKLESWKKTIEKDWESVEIASLLERQAEKHCKRNDSIRRNAQSYYCMRKLESLMLDIYFPDTIFFSYSSDKLQSLYPKLPKLYLWPLRRGRSEAPWLIEELSG